MTGILYLALTVALYFLCRRLYMRWPLTVLSPMLTCPGALILILVTAGVPYPRYIAGAHWLTAFLQPATVAFAIPLYRHRRLLLRCAAPIACALAAGSVSAIWSSFGLAQAAHLGRTVALSLAPRSVTTPIAMQISQAIGGNPVLTSVFVLWTGILGATVGPWLIRILRIRSPIGQGILMGMGAHGIGTNRAFAFGLEAGTASTLAMVLAALLGVLLTPLLLRLWP
ncbi:LrgB family protein [Alicyclobacillus kakegawensis]|uniref:LrgB family protein n=1 Tax=Alicyclobacillus kakegawensis TaxID=392012 RepID=UPI0009F863D0|nr:LrgB family protein [Alicyclobacillus kakegawensis]